MIALTIYLVLFYFIEFWCALAMRRELWKLVKTEYYNNGKALFMLITHLTVIPFWAPFWAIKKFFQWCKKS